MSIRKILAEEGLVKKAGSGYFDFDGNELQESEVEAIRSGDPEKLARVLVALHGDDFDLWLDSCGKVISQIFKEEGLGARVQPFRNKVESLANKLLEAQEKEEFLSSPYKKELQALANGMRGFTSVVPPSKVKYLRVQPRLKGGQIFSLLVEDLDGRFGDMRVGVGRASAEEAGTTLEAVIEAVGKLGGKVKTRGMGPGKPKPAIGYDGWAW